MNVLITSASRKVNLVRSFQQVLAQKGGGKVIAVDTSPFSPALYLADEHYLVPPSNTPDFSVTMLRLCRELGVRLLIPTRDEELLWFSENKANFAKVGTFVMVSDPATVRTCQDKKAFVEFCQQHGFSVPTTYDAGSLSADAPFPLFVKPRFGKGGAGTMRVDSREGLAVALGHMPNAIIQEFLRDPEYTLDVFADLSGKVLSVVPRERIHVVAGEAFVSRSSNNPTLIQEAIRLASKLPMIGHNTIQCFLCGNAVKFVEINARFGGAAHLGFAAGACTPLFLVRLLLGEKVEPIIGAFRDNYVMLRYTEDLFLDGDSLADRLAP